MTKRVRNYSAERARRNELARQRGYTSLDAQHKARRAGNRSPIDVAPLRNRKPVAPAPSEPDKLPDWFTSDRELNAACRRWAKEFGRQPGTRNYDSSWPRARRLAFYQAFVIQDGRHKGEIDDYIYHWPNGFRSEIVEQIANSRQFYANRR